MAFHKQFAVAFALLSFPLASIADEATTGAEAEAQEVVSADAEVAEVTSAEQLIEVTLAELRTSQIEDTAEVILQHVNVRAVAEIVLGNFKKEISAEERTRFEVALDDLLRRTITANAEQFTGVDVRIIRADTRGRNAIVKTRVEAEGEDPYTLRWRLLNLKDEWFVIDLEFADLWLAIEQKAQVKAIMDRPGATIDDVIAELG